MIEVTPHQVTGWEEEAIWGSNFICRQQTTEISRVDYTMNHYMKHLEISRNNKKGTTKIVTTSP